MSKNNPAYTHKDTRYMTLSLCLKQFSVAGLYLLCGYWVHCFIPISDDASVIWPSSGLALAALLLGGGRYIVGVLLGSVLLNALSYASPWAIAGMTLANVMETLLGYWLLTRNSYTLTSLQTLSNYFNLVVLGAGVASIIGTTLGVTSLMLAGYVTSANYFATINYQWMAHAGGIVLVTTFLLAWLPFHWTQWRLATQQQILEAIFLIALTFLVGQVVFLNGFHDTIGQIARDYWLFLFISWVALRLGVRGVTAALMLVAIQALAGALKGTGYFSDDLAETSLHNYWYFMVIISLVGITLATYVTGIRKSLEALSVRDNALNVAANGIVITRLDGRIEWANQAFSQLTGYDLDEVYLRNPKELVSSGLHDKAFYQTLWHTILARNVWHGEIINRRKDGSLYDEEMTITPLVDEHNVITHFVAVKQDITARKQIEKALKDSEQQFRCMLENSPIAVSVMDRDTGQVKFANQCYVDLIQVPPEQVLSVNLSQYYANPRDYSDLTERLNKGQRVSNQLIQLIIPNENTTKWVLASYLVIKFQNESALLGWFYDISDRKIIEEKLHVSDRAMKAISQGVVVMGADQNIMSVNNAFELITGYCQEEILGRNCDFLQGALTSHKAIGMMRKAIRAGTEFSGEVLNYRKDGTPFWNELTITPLRDEQGQANHFIGITRDITERKKMQEQVQQLAFYDPLTHLPNRRLLSDRMRQTIAASKRKGYYNAVMVLDMDNFKPLNDKHGHLVGDLLLIEVANRLQQSVREMDTVARFGGDEFVVLLNELHADKTTALAQAGFVAEKIRMALSTPYSLNAAAEKSSHVTIEHHCSVSIGVAVFSDPLGDQDEALNWADAAMYKAKKAGRNLIRFYEKDD